jgi:Holliday junction resolvase RusA-like endonuclease
MGHKFVARFYDSDSADEWKAAVDSTVLEQQVELSPQLKSGAFHVSLYFTFQRPKAHFRFNGELKEAAPMLHRQKPDLDNLAKLILDRITRSGKFWADDCQVIDLTVCKEWARDGERPGVRVMIISEP